MTGRVILWYGGNYQSERTREVLSPLCKGGGAPHVLASVDGDALPDHDPADVILAIGKDALGVLAGRGLVKKNASVKSLRQTPVELPSGARVLVSYDPTITLYDAARLPEIGADYQLAARIATTGSADATLGAYRYVDDFGELCARVHRRAVKTGKRVQVAFDLETIGLDPYATPDDHAVYVDSIAFSDGPGRGDVVRFRGPDDPRQPTTNPLLMKQLRWLLNSKRVFLVGANLKFDAQWLSVFYGIEEMRAFLFDTTIVGSLLNENRNNSLNLHAKLYAGALGGYDDSLNAQYDKGRMDLIPDADHLPYAAGDVDACYRVARVFRKRIAKVPHLAKFYALVLHPAALAFAVLERRGVIVDRAAYETVREELQAELDAARAVIDAELTDVVRERYADNLSPTRPALLIDMLFSPDGFDLTPRMWTPTGRPSTSYKDHLHMFDDNQGGAHVEFVRALQRHSKAAKMMNTYVVGHLKHLRSDGRYHASYMLHAGAYGDRDEMSGSNTGRTSAKDPSIQTVPKHGEWAPRLRRVFVPPPGHVVLKADFSQGELRVAADRANVASMIGAYRKGIDMHLVTGSEVAGITLADALNRQAEADALNARKAAGKKLTPAASKFLAAFKLMRQGGKAGNFGLLYGMGVNGFRTYAERTYGVAMSEEQALHFRHRFFETKPELLRWHDRMRHLAHANREVVSPLGRVRHLPLIDSRDDGTRAKSERQAINSTVQSTLSDMGQLAISLLQRRYPELWVFMFTHDDIACYVPEDEVALWAGRIREVVENLPLREWFGWRHRVDFPVDMELATEHLGSTVEYREPDDWNG